VSWGSFRDCGKRGGIGQTRDCCPLKWRGDDEERWRCACQSAAGINLCSDRGRAGCAVMRCGSVAWQKSLEVGQAASAREIRSPHWVCEKWLRWRVARPASAGQRHGRHGYPASHELRRRPAESQLDILRNTMGPRARSCMAARYESKAHIAVSLRRVAAPAVTRAPLLVVGQGDVHLRTVCLGSSSVPLGQMTRSNRPRSTNHTQRKNI
jgi:hypothetical protein